MAEKKKGYPLLPTGHWWALREKFSKSIPGTVSANYLAAVLSMAEMSAQKNILPSLRSMNLIGDDGKPTDLAVQWRDDAQYPKVCSAILKAVYPKELLDIGSGPEVDRESIARWFANHTAAGVSAVRKMVAMYLLLCEADPKQAKPVVGKASSAAAPKKSAAVSPKMRTQTTITNPEPPVEKSGKNSNTGMPGLHINVQVHISSDATPDQIEQIFASMAKHLYGN